MIWKVLIRIARSLLGRGRAADLIADVSEEITESVYPAVFPSARPPPLPDPTGGTSYPLAYTDVQRQQDLSRSAARAFPPSALPPSADFPPVTSSVATLPPRAPRARASAAPPPIMPRPARVPRKP